MTVDEFLALLEKHAHGSPLPYFGDRDDPKMILVDAWLNVEAIVDDLNKAKDK